MAYKGWYEYYNIRELYFMIFIGIVELCYN